MAHGTLVFTVAVGLTAVAINPVSMTYGYEKSGLPSLYSSVIPFVLKLLLVT